MRMKDKNLAQRKKVLSEIIQVKISRSLMSKYNIMQMIRI